MPDHSHIYSNNNCNDDSCDENSNEGSNERSDKSNDNNSGYRKPDIHRFHRAFIDLGINPNPVYQQLGLDPKYLQNPDSTLTMHSYFALLNRLSISSNRRFLTVDLIRVFDNDDMGVLIHILRCADSFKQLLDLLQRYICLVSPSAEINLQESGEYYTLQYHHPEFSPELSHQDVEGTLGQVVLLIQVLLDNSNWLAPQMFFQHQKKYSDDNSQYPLATEVCFEHSFSGMSFPKALFNYPVPSSNSSLLKILEDSVSRRSESYFSQQSFINSVRLIISSQLNITGLSSSNVAHQLNLSRRTLNRKLQDNGVSYKQLREEIVIDLAKQSLSLTDSSVAEIAQALGYSESSAFNRMFKRLTQNTPLQYRKHLKMKR